MLGKRTSSMSLTGKPSGGGVMSLTGRNESIATTLINRDVKELQLQLMDRFLFPLMRRDTTAVYRNFYLLPGLRSKITSLKDRNPDLQYYESLLTFIEDSYSVYKTVTNSYAKDGENTGFGNFMVRTVTVSLKPEYHLYNLIIGKPPKNVEYDEEIIAYIMELMTRVNLTFNEIYMLVRRRFGYPEVPLS
jgi:hypothetical protein